LQTPSLSRTRRSWRTTVLSVVPWADGPAVLLGRPPMRRLSILREATRDGFQCCCVHVWEAGDWQPRYGRVLAGEEVVRRERPALAANLLSLMRTRHRPVFHGADPPPISYRKEKLWTAPCIYQNHVPGGCMLAYCAWRSPEPNIDFSHPGMLSPFIVIIPPGQRLCSNSGLPTLRVLPSKLRSFSPLDSRP
jgi:hypothetical protein